MTHPPFPPVRLRPAAIAAAGLLWAGLASQALAGSVVVTPVAVAEWKAVHGRVETRDTVPARARTGGTLVELSVAEGDSVKAGQRIGVVRDDKIAFQIAALESQLKGLQAQLQNAENELTRGQTLVDRGVGTAQRLDQLRTQADVFRNQIAATEAQRQVVIQQGSEGEILAPVAGRVLTVPVTKGAVVMAGEAVATIGGGGFFLRLAIPERHAGLLRAGARLSVETGREGAGITTEGRLAKIYPQIANGRVVADVEVPDLPTAFVDARLLVRVPIGQRQALMVPAAALKSRSGLDFLVVRTKDRDVERSVVVGETIDGRVEILTGLSAGEEVVTP